jgi:hypothetical protein
VDELVYAEPDDTPTGSWKRRSQPDAADEELPGAGRPHTCPKPAPTDEPPLNVSPPKKLVEHVLQLKSPYPLATPKLNTAKS